MKPPQDLTARLVAHMDSENTLSLSEILNKFFVRWKLFVTCVVLVPAILVGLTFFVPQPFKARAQLLVSRAGSTAYFKDVTSERETITAQSAAELLRSIPVCVRMIEIVGVTDEDIARPAYKTLFSRFLRTIKPLLGKEEDDTGKDPKLKTERLAETLKDSIDTSTLQIDRSIINPRDEVIEVKLKSTNRTKVAAMVNQLCRSFIDEYNSRSADDAVRAHEVLTAQAAKIQAEIASLRDPAKIAVSSTTLPATRDATEATAESSTLQAKPLAQGMGTKISDLEMKVIELERIYTDTAPEVVRAREELDQARNSLTRQEALDGASALLDLLRKKQRQALVSAALHRSNQSGISLIEEGVTPSPSKVGLLMHYGLPAAGGLIGGLVLGSALVFLLSALDNRVHTVADLDHIGGLPLRVETISLAANIDRTALNLLPPQENISPLLRVCGAMELASGPVGRRAILVTSADHGTDGGETALQLACLLARNNKLRLLLIDGDLQQATLTKRLRLESAPGLIEAMTATPALPEATQPSALNNLSIMPAGNLATRANLGFFSTAWRQRLEEMRSSYDVVILHAPGVIDHAETPVFAREMDQALFVTVRGATLRNSMERALPLLKGFGLHILGTVLLTKPGNGRIPA